MYRRSVGISIIEAALAIGLIAIVSIGVLSILGSNINTMFSKSEKSFEGYKPFNWGTPATVGAKPPAIGSEENSGGASSLSTANGDDSFSVAPASTNNINGLNYPIGLNVPMETTGASGTEDIISTTSTTGGTYNNSTPEESAEFTFGESTRSSGGEDTIGTVDILVPTGGGVLVGVETSGAQAKANQTPNGNIGSSSLPTGF